MGLSEYDVVINGFPTTVQLDEVTAKARGLIPVKVAEAPVTKARTRTRTKKV